MINGSLVSLKNKLCEGADFNFYEMLINEKTTPKNFMTLRSTMIDGPFGTIPIEIKLNSVVKRISLRGLERFLTDQAGYGILINRGKRPELLTDRIIQIPVNYI